MERYRDLSGNSGVDAYESGPDWIRLRFKHGGTYLYNHIRPGPTDVARMKELACSGNGLATYINQHVRGAYARRED